MSKTWFEPKEKLPPQMKKVLTRSGGGDYIVRHRIGKYWFPIPFTDSKFSDTKEPEVWQEIEFYGGNHGYVKVLINDELINFDELEIKHPAIYKEFLEDLLNGMKTNKK